MPCLSYDKLFLLDGAGPHQDPWLRGLAFAVVAAAVRDVSLALCAHPEAAGTLNRYCFPLLPLLNASLALDTSLSQPQAQAPTPAGAQAPLSAGHTPLPPQHVQHARARTAASQQPCLEEYRSGRELEVWRADTNLMLHNAAYCLGIVAQHGGEGVALQALDLHPLLLALLRSSDAAVGDAVRDNAVCLPARLLARSLCVVEARIEDSAVAVTQDSRCWRSCSCCRCPACEQARVRQGRPTHAPRSQGAKSKAVAVL